MLAAAIRQRRITLEQAAPVINRAVDLALEFTELQEARYFLALVQPWLAVTTRAGEEGDLTNRSV